MLSMLISVRARPCRQPARRREPRSRRSRRLEISAVTPEPSFHLRMADAKPECRNEIFHSSRIANERRSLYDYRNSAREVNGRGPAAGAS